MDVPVDVVDIPSGPTPVTQGSGFRWSGFGAINVRGSYNDADTYYRSDIVNHNETLYWCIQENNGIVLSNTDYWTVIGSSGFNYVDGALVYTATAEVDLNFLDIVDFSVDGLFVTTQANNFSNTAFMPTGIVASSAFAAGELATVLVRGELPYPNTNILGVVAAGSTIYYDQTNRSLTTIANDFRVGRVTMFGETQSQISFDLGGVDSTFSNEATDNLITANTTNLGSSGQFSTTNFDDVAAVTVDIAIQNLIPSITLMNNALVVITGSLSWAFDNDFGTTATGSFTLDLDGTRVLDRFAASTPISSGSLQFNITRSGLANQAVGGDNSDYSLNLNYIANSFLSTFDVGNLIISISDVNYYIQYFED